MLVRDLKRLALIVGPILGLLLVSLTLWDRQSGSIAMPPNVSVTSLFGKTFGGGDQAPLQHGSGDASDKTPPSIIDIVSGDVGNGTHHAVFSVSTPDKKFFRIRFGDHSAMNPNIIPHPMKEDTWIIVAQENGAEDEQNKQPDGTAIHRFFTELGCDARFVDGVLQCIGAPKNLPIAATLGDKCDGDLAFMGWNVGPHDARVFYGPKKPYTLFGSNGGFTCFGMWLQDFRVLVDWGYEMFTQDDFRVATELQRPPPYGFVEKNWFVFWDKDKQMYAHYDVAPKRVFARLGADGSMAGQDLAPFAAATDEKCMGRYLPKLAPELESIHQATNSLSITLCRRADKSCQENDGNTFIFTIFQHKTYYDFHSEYEPYVMMFRQRAPFEIYGISRKPIWIHGRQRSEGRRTDMFYVVSMSWKTRGQKYHGYLDDVLFLSFGIEDKESGGIDVLASDLLMGLGLCSEP